MQSIFIVAFCLIYLIGGLVSYVYADWNPGRVLDLVKLLLWPLAILFVKK